MKTADIIKNASLEVLNGSLAGESFPLQDEVLIGRCDDEQSTCECHIALSDDRVSRRHARIIRRDNGYAIQDLGSTNGTLLNSHLLVAKEFYVLREGCNLQLGGVHMRFRPPATTSPANSSATSIVNAAVKDSVPDEDHLWGSEIGGNEEAFDLALIAGGAQEPLAPSQASMVLLESASSKIDLSMAIDAREALQGLNEKLQKDRESATDAQCRLRALAQVSVGLGGQDNSEELLARVMDFIFDIFPSAEHAYGLLCDTSGAGCASLKPVVAMSRKAGRVEVTLSRTIVDEVIRHRQAILSSDAQSDKRFDSYESIIGLDIRSVMCAPLLLDDEVFGLIQVDTRNTHAFDREDLQILAGIGAQAAIALKNLGLVDNIQQLFEGFVKASVHAIEARDPNTAGHSFRVAEYSLALAEAVGRSNMPGLRDVNFSSEQMDELRYAALLHDFGKVGVREHVLTKKNKLYPRQFEVMEERFKLACVSVERQAYRELLDELEGRSLSPQEIKERRLRVEVYLAKERQRIWDFMEPISNANKPTVSYQMVSQTLRKALKDAMDYRFPGADGELVPLLSSYEMNALTLARGSLTPSERQEIEHHVTHTYAFLQHIPWTTNLASVPSIAYAHHERLDGSGYPRGLEEKQIPLRARIMMVTDIYDALIASERPYKSSVEPELALDILRAEAKEGKISADLVDIFVESKVYQLQLKR